MFNPPIFASIITGKTSARELELQMFSLQLWQKENELPLYYIFTDSETVHEINKIKYPSSKLFYKAALEIYKGYTRIEMEQICGKKYKTLWTDFMSSKIDCIRWAFKQNPATSGVFFVDSDILFLASLPTIPPFTQVALSPHYIKTADTDKYGYYNCGFGWIAKPSLCDTWEAATHTSRFFEQAALEDVARSVPPAALYEFPDQHDFGWWRMFQSDDVPTTVVSRFGFYRLPLSSGITYKGKSLGSIHSHWADENTDVYNTSFNQFILKKLKVLKNSHIPANLLYSFLTRRF